MIQAMFNKVNTRTEKDIEIDEFWAMWAKSDSNSKYRPVILNITRLNKMLWEAT